MPHQAVVRENKDTTKVRIAFNASSKVRDEPSLNDCSYSGPFLLPAIYGILLQFPLGKIGFLSDIKQAFLNIAIAEEHRDLLRFLWYENFDADDPEVIILRFTRVVFGLKGSPFLLNGTISSHVSQNIVNEIHNVAVLKRLLRNLYVDDSTISFNSFNQGVEFYTIAKKYLSKGGFDFRKWETNDPKLIERLHKQS